MTKIDDHDEVLYEQYADGVLNPDTFRWHEAVRHDPSLEYVKAYREIERLNLQQYAAELDAFGYTVVPPDVFAPRGFAAAVLERSLEVLARTRGIAVDPTTGLESWGLEPREVEDLAKSSFGLTVPCLVAQDRIFETLLMNEVNLALISYLIGEWAMLYAYVLIVKGPQSPAIDLHADTFFMPPPWPPYAILGQSLIVLSDYSEADGATGFVPGSHRLGRLPRPGEAEDRKVFIEAPAGSLIVFSGHTWHCAAARTKPGFRAAIALHFCRHWVQTQTDFRGLLPPETLDRNPPRFRRLLHEAPMFVDPASNPCRP